MIEKPIPQLGIDDLQRLYTDGEECDKRVFAEMRTNMQIVAGDHYTREGSKYWNRIRSNRQLTNEQRLKLTKNHTQRVTKIYRNQIESHSPDVAIYPANESELQDQKSAEMHQAYWNYIKECEDFESKRALWVQDFVEKGEVAVKVYWSMDGGQIIGYEAEVQRDPAGEMVLDENEQPIPVYDPMTGEPVPTDTPVYGGKIKFETIPCYNLRRDPDSQSMKESPYLIYSKLISRNAIRTFIKDEEELKKFVESPLSEFTIYDNNTGTYKVSQNQCLVKEVYFRPAPAIPKGYFFIYTDTHILASGELPYGIFPIIHEGFDTQSGNARSYSIIRPIRPAQVEINRCASKIAEHQTTIGDDKVWIPANTKVQQGSLLPGIRTNVYTGVKPEVTPGRSGDQYFEYLSRQIDELYVLANIPEVNEPAQTDGADLYSNLLKSFRFRRKFAIYGQKFERFLVQVARTALDLAKHSANENELIPAVGKSEYINMAEFKNSENIHHQIRLSSRTDDIDSDFGKQITLNHIIQYVGPNLGKEDIGQMLRLSPFLNKEKMLEKFTQKYDNVVNDILALDRGQWREPRKYDDHAYVISALTSRMSKADYERMDPQIKQLYEAKLQAHEQLKAQELMEIQKAQAGFIPSGGYLVACDFYQGDPSNPSKTKRIRVPSESLNWLIKRLEEQGMHLDQLERLPKGVLSDVGSMVMEKQPNLLSSMLPQGEPNAA